MKRRPVAKTEEWPLLISEGSVTVKIYRGETRKELAGELRRYPFFTLAYSQNGKRQRQNFADLDEAKREGKAVARKISTGEIQALLLKDADRASYIAALDALKEGGTRLEVAASEYAEAVKILEGKGSVLEAARFFVRHYAGTVNQKRVPEVVEELILTKKQDQASQAYLHDLQVRLGQFAASFGGYIANVRTAEIEAWMRGLNLSGRSRNNYRNVVILLFNFAKAKGYLPRDRSTDAENLPRAKEKGGDIEIFTPKEFSDLLAECTQELKCHLLFGAFAGLRSAEIQRLHWEDVSLQTGFITINRRTSKIGRRRLVPILPNLARWLTFEANEKGPVSLVQGDVKYWQWLSMLNKERAKEKLSPLVWKNNGLRHSFISYRVAQTKNIPQVAMEAGNSPAMIHEHYLELVTPNQAEQWFSMIPEMAANVVHMIA